MGFVFLLNTEGLKIENSKGNIPFRGGENFRLLRLLRALECGIVMHSQSVKVLTKQNASRRIAQVK